MSIPVNYKCRDCGLAFGVVINEDQKGHIPCPGCAGHNLEETAQKNEDFYLLSREADECSGNCACCGANCANRSEAPEK